MRQWVMAAGIGLAWSAPAHAFELTPKAQAALARGEAYAEVAPDPDGISGRVKAVVDIAAPPEKVWAIMTDCATAGRMITNLASCRIVSGDQRKGWDIREHVTRRTFVFPGMRIVFRSDYEPVSRIRFHLVEGDLKVEQGEWRLERLDGGRGTRVFYDNRLAVDWPVPKGMIREALRKDTPKVLMNLRRACE